MLRSSSTPGPSRELAARVRRLVDTAAEAKHASSALPVTRLTVLKSLCKDPADAARFLLHLATAARDRIVHGRRPGHLTPATWQRHQALATEAVACLEKHLDARRSSDAGKLSDLLLRLTEEQDERKPAAWGDVRLIHNRDLLVVEEAVEGILVPEARALGVPGGPVVRRAVRTQPRQRPDPRVGAAVRRDRGLLVPAQLQRAARQVAQDSCDESAEAGRETRSGLATAVGAGRRVRISHDRHVGGGRRARIAQVATLDGPEVF